MADIQTETLQALRRLERVMSELPGTIMAAGTRVPRNATNREKFKFDSKNPVKDEADQKRLTKAMEDQTKASKLLFKDLNKISSDMMIAGGMFNKAVQQMSFKNFEQLPGKLRDVIKTLHGNIETYEDVLRVQKRSIMSNVDAAEQLYKQFLKLDPNMKGYQKALDSLTKEMEKTGYTMEDFSGYTADAAGTMKKLNDNAKKGAKGLKEVAESSMAAASHGKALGGILKFLGGAALTVAQYFINSATSAMKYGTTAAPIASLLAGMTPEAFAKLQKDNIQAARSGFKSLSDFNTAVDHGARKMFVYTGSLEAAAKLRAGEIDQFQSLGRNIGNVSGFVDVQEKQFVQLNRIVSVTSEEFTELNAQLMNSAVVQAQLYKLGAQQRVAYYEDLQNARKKLVIDGLTIQQAQKVVETFQQIAGERPQDRIKQAAKLEAIGGAIGLGGPTLTRLANLIRSGMRGPGAAAEAAKLEAQLQPQLQAITANQSATLGTETSFRALVDQVPELLGANNVAAGLGITGKGLTQKQQRAALRTDFLGRHAGPGGQVTSGVSEVVAGLLKVENITKVVGIDIVGTLKQGFGMLGGIISGGSLLGGLSGLFGGGGGGAAEALGGRLVGNLGKLGTFGKVLPIIGPLLAAGGTYLATGNAGAATGSGVGTLVGGALGTLLDPFTFGAGTFIGGAAGGWLGEKLGKWATGGTGKSALPGGSGIAQYSKLEQNYQNEAKELQKAQLAGNKALVETLTEKMQVIMDKMAHLEGNDPTTKAVKDVNKTLKEQHQENKNMTQEQIDAFNKTHKVIMTKTTRDVLGPSY